MLLSFTCLLLHLYLSWSLFPHVCYVLPWNLAYMYVLHVINTAYNCNPIELWNLCCTKVVTWMGGHSLFTWLDVVISMLHVRWQCRWYNLTTLLVWMVELLYLNGMLTSSCAWLSLSLSLIIKGYMYCMQHHALSYLRKTLHLYEANTHVTCWEYAIDFSAAYNYVL